MDARACVEPETARCAPRATSFHTEKPDLSSRSQPFPKRMERTRELCGAALLPTAEHSFPASVIARALLRLGERDPNFVCSSFRCADDAPNRNLCCVACHVAASRIWWEERAEDLCQINLNSFALRSALAARHTGLEEATTEERSWEQVYCRPVRKAAKRCSLRKRYRKAEGFLFSRAVRVYGRAGHRKVGRNKLT